MKACQKNKNHGHIHRIRLQMVSMNEFYKALTNDWEKYLDVKLFRTEDGVGFEVLLFISKCALYDLFEPKKFNKSNFMFIVFLLWTTAMILFQNI
jgi:HSP90 family molecular chaperone